MKSKAESTGFGCCVALDKERKLGIRRGLVVSTMALIPPPTKRMTTPPLNVAKGRTNALINTSDRSDVTLEVAATVFRTLQSVAAASPIPGLKLAADLALKITTTVQVCIHMQ